MDPLRFDLSWNAVQFLSGSSAGWLSQRYCEGQRVLPGCFSTYNEPLPGLDNNGRSCFHLNWSLSPPPKRGPLRFGFSWNAGKFLSGSSKRTFYQSCCDGLRVLLLECSNTSNKPLTDLGNNSRPCFCLNWSLSFPRVDSSQVRFELKCWPMSCSSTHRLYQKCCDGQRVLSESSHIKKQASTRSG